MPAFNKANSLFLSAESYQLDRPYIDVPAGLGLQQAYDLAERFLTLNSLERDDYFIRYDGEQSAYAFRIGEAALAMSRVLWSCQGDLTMLPEHFAAYWQGHDPIERPHGIQHAYQTTMFDFRQILWTYTDTACEWFFSYLAAHRHLIAQAAHGDDGDAAPVGRNRYHDYLRAGNAAKRAGLISYLRTDLRQLPYVRSLQRFYAAGGRDSRGHFIIRETDTRLHPFGSLVQGVLTNWLAPPASYDCLFLHMDELFCAITGSVLPDARNFLRAVFEIQYWYIHLMPCERGSADIMSMFRHAMLAYYNRRQPDRARWLPISPNRIDIYPDLEALFLRASLAAFIEASFQELYCVDYTIICNS